MSKSASFEPSYENPRMTRFTCIPLNILCKYLLLSLYNCLIYCFFFRKLKPGPPNVETLMNPQLMELPLK